MDPEGDDSSDILQRLADCEQKIGYRFQGQAAATFGSDARFRCSTPSGVERTTRVPGRRHSRRDRLRIAVPSIPGIVRGSADENQNRSSSAGKRVRKSANVWTWNLC